MIETNTESSQVPGYWCLVRGSQSHGQLYHLHGHDTPSRWPRYYYGRDAGEELAASIRDVCTPVLPLDHCWRCSQKRSFSLWSRRWCVPHACSWQTRTICNWWAGAQKGSQSSESISCRAVPCQESACCCCALSLHYLASSFCERINSCANQILTLGNTLLRDNVVYWKETKRKINNDLQRN